jgi:hypothetical protein
MRNIMKKHTHKLERVQLGSNGYTVYKCILPGCSTFYQKDLTLGHITLCHGCNEEIVMTKSMIQNHGVGIKKPMCDKCIEEKKDRRSRLSQIGELR